MAEHPGTKITGSMLYDLVQCPTRVHMDCFANPADKVEVSPFVRLLWERGAEHEADTVSKLGEPCLDLAHLPAIERETKTIEAIKSGVPLIHGGRIRKDDLLGDPDLLRKTSYGYIAGDIKSGAGLEGNEDLSKPKKHYAVQIALYTDILRQLNFSQSYEPFILDINRQTIPYNLLESIDKGGATLWETYEVSLQNARDIVAKRTTPRPASCAICKLCQWYEACKTEIKRLDDLTLIPGLGRSKRDSLALYIDTVDDLAQCDISAYTKGKKTIFPGIGPESLLKFKKRAQLLKDPSPKPYLTEAISFPAHSTELFFDIEVDPLRDFCYLHGFVKRTSFDNQTEEFVGFFTDDESCAEERSEFKKAYEFILSNRPCSIYYYSKYERTIWRKLQAKYPDVCSQNDIEIIFDPANAIDLYFDVVTKKTEWPTNDHSIKTLAKYLGFSWRDKNPSGAASIEWFDKWVKSRDPSDKERILLYNEDDCRATRVLLDGIKIL